MGEGETYFQIQISPEGPLEDLFFPLLLALDRSGEGSDLLLFSFLGFLDVDGCGLVLG